jgi:hypothetical protein
MEKKSSSGGIGFVGMLTIVFIVLKLTHVIDWSWWWVMSPIWGVAALILAVVILLVIWYLIGRLVMKIKMRNYTRRRTRK